MGALVMGGNALTMGGNALIMGARGTVLPVLTTPYSNSLVLVGSGGDIQDGVARSSVWNYVNPDSTLLQISATNFFGTGAGLKEYDIIHGNVKNDSCSYSH